MSKRVLLVTVGALAVVFAFASIQAARADGWPDQSCKPNGTVCNLNNQECPGDICWYCPLVWKYDCDEDPGYICDYDTGVECDPHNEGYWGTCEGEICRLASSPPECGTYAECHYGPE